MATRSRATSAFLSGGLLAGPLQGVAASSAACALELVKVDWPGNAMGLGRGDYSGARTEEVRVMHGRGCEAIGGHAYVSATIPTRAPGLLGIPTEEVGACVPEVCVDGGGGVVDGGIVEAWVDKILEYRCRDGHPTIFYFWPDPAEVMSWQFGPAGFEEWAHRVSERFNGDMRKLVVQGAIAECPAAACAVYATALSNQNIDGFPKQQLLDAIDMSSACYEELLRDVGQLALYGALGFNLGLLELSIAKAKELIGKIQPWNPHHDEGRLIWRDYYSGLYPPVDYSEQFDMQWRLALEDPRGKFGVESSVRLDDCALNDMIESTFGEREYLDGCSEENRSVHEEKERGIIRRNFMLLDAERVKGQAALDVGCGFGRWTAMLKRLGADVTSVDASPNAVKSTKRYNPDKTFQMTLFDLPNWPGLGDGFDLVVCWGVLQHTHDPVKAFKIVASAVREGGMLFTQVYNDHSKAAYPFTQRLRSLFHKLESDEEKVRFLKLTAPAAGADVFDHLDGMLTFYNWAVHEETVRSWYLENGFVDYWKVWNYKYVGRKRALERPVRDDAGQLLTTDLGEAQSGVPYYPIIQGFS